MYVNLHSQMSHNRYHHALAQYTKNCVAHSAILTFARYISHFIWLTDICFGRRHMVFLLIMLCYTGSWFA